jgi:hypothetical protein
MNRVITIITNSYIKDIKPEYLRVLFKSRKDSIPLSGEKFILDIKYFNEKKSHYFVRVFNYSLNNIEDLISAVGYYTKNVDPDIVYKKIFIRFTKPTN